MKKIYMIGIGIFLSVASINAQSISNINASVSGSNVVITYDLIASEKGQRFKIDLKSSEDGFLRVLKEVSGDVGKSQSAGSSKKIIWDARKEIGAFQGDISFEITATVTFSPLNFITPTKGANVKIGKAYMVKWSGGSLDRNLKLELLKNNSQVIDMGNVSNTGTYSWNVPKTMTKGENFNLKLFDPTKPNDAVLSASFNLKKTPIIIYIGAGAVVAGVAAAVLLGGNDGDGNTSDNPIDEPPALPGG